MKNLIVLALILAAVSSNAQEANSDIVEKTVPAKDSTTPLPGGGSLIERVEKSEFFRNGRRVAILRTRVSEISGKPESKTKSTDLIVPIREKRQIQVDVDKPAFFSFEIDSITVAASRHSVLIASKEDDFFEMIFFNEGGGISFLKNDGVEKLRADFSK